MTYHNILLLFSDMTTLFRMPYFSRKICDGGYGRAEIRAKVKELYIDSLDGDGEDFIDAISDSITDQYDYQRVSKKISSGLTLKQ